MKLNDIALLVLIVILTMFLKLDVNQKKQIEAEQLKIKYRHIVQQAVQDASSALVEKIDDNSHEKRAEGEFVNINNMQLNLDKALWRFYQTMYINLNIENDFIKQEIVSEYFPIKIAIGYDGYYINAKTYTINTLTGKYEPHMQWQPKNDYVLYDRADNIDIRYTLDNYVYINDRNDNKQYEGDYSTLQVRYPTSIYFNSNTFDSIRRQTIINGIRNDLEYYASKFNRLALKQGISYRIKLPYIDSNSISDIGFIAFLQGIPLNGTEKYNTYGMGITRTVNKRKYFGYEINGMKFYHNDKYTRTGNNPVIFNTAKEAACDGYYPDPACQ
jgi:hypothetical protein